MTRTRPTSLSARWRHGLLAASFLFACWSLPASGTVSSNPLFTSAAFAQAGGAGSVSAVFLTDAGVYGLDADSAAIRAAVPPVFFPCSAPLTIAPYPACSTARITSSGAAVPSTDMELVSSETVTESTAASFDTAFSTCA